MSEPADTDHPPAGRSLPQFLSYRIVKLHQALNAQASAILEEKAGITLGQWRIIAMIGTATAQTSRDLAQRSAMDPAFVSRTLRTMEDDGLVEISRAEHDRRMLVVSLSPKALRIFEETMPTMQARQQALLDALDPVEQDVVFRIIDKLELAAEQRAFEA